MRKDGKKNHRKSFLRACNCYYRMNEQASLIQKLAFVVMRALREGMERDDDDEREERAGANVEAAIACFTGLSSFEKVFFGVLISSSESGVAMPCLGDGSLRPSATLVHHGHDVESQTLSLVVSVIGWSSVTPP